MFALDVLGVRVVCAGGPGEGRRGGGAYSRLHSLYNLSVGTASWCRERPGTLFNSPYKYSTVHTYLNLTTRLTLLTVRHLVA